MNPIIERCAALDIGKRTLTACVRSPDGQGGRRSETRTFPCEAYPVGKSDGALSA